MPPETNPPATNPTAFNERVEALVAALDASPDVRSRALAQELVALVLAFHKPALSRLVAAVHDDRPAALRVLDDELVASVLALHDLLPSHAPPLIQIARAPVGRETGRTPREPHADACGACGAELLTAHRHIVDLESRRLSCACRACWLLAGSDGRQRAVPDRYRQGPPLHATDALWTALQLPVDLAFFMHNSVAGRTFAFYPSPAGATESALALESWHQIVAANPWVKAMEPDVEALLVRTDRATDHTAAYIVPIDACYELAGLIRTEWTGLTGGSGAERAIAQFFEEIARRSTPVAAASSDSVSRIC
jgi:hypothetical protein